MLLNGMLTGQDRLVTLHERDGIQGNLAHTGRLYQDPRVKHDTKCVGVGSYNKAHGD